MGKLIDGLTRYDSRAMRWNLKLFAWTAGWAGTLVLADKAILYGWHDSGSLAAALVALNAVLGIGVVLTYTRMIRCMDELQRKITYEALALAVGVGFVSGFSLSLMATSGFVAGAEATDLLLIMGVTFMLSLVVGTVRYR